MATQYRAFSGNLNDLDVFLKSNTNILNRCLFHKSWNWIGYGENAQYVDTFNIDLSDSEICTPYDIESNRKFFEAYEAGKLIGHWSGELFHKICDIEKHNNIDCGSSMEVKHGCYVFTKSTSKQTISVLAKLIQNYLGLKTRIEKNEKGRYSIYIHCDQSTLDTLPIITLTGELKPIKKLSDRKALEKAEKHLIKELQKIQKQLKDA